MALTAGVLSIQSFTNNQVVVSSTAASGGTGPYTQQLYASTTSGFSVGSGNLVSGATALLNTVSGLNPNAIWYFKMVYTDTGNSNVTVTSLQVSQQLAAPGLSQNQFAQLPYVGLMDQAFNYNTKSCQIDISQNGLLYPGTPVKVLNSAYGVPKVVACTSLTDAFFGFLNYDFKDAYFQAGSMCQVSQSGNVIYVYSTTAIQRGYQVCMDILGQGVQAATGSSTYTIVGKAYDDFTGPGVLGRIEVATSSLPNLTVDG